ncbi:MAG: hypothetical protein WCQ16_06495 [Verrucomicrobiae bacterium]
MTIQISEDALDDLNEGFLFYEVQASGLGDYFTSCLRADIEGLRFSAGIHRIREAQAQLSKLCRGGRKFVIANRDKPVFVALPVADMWRTR